MPRISAIEIENFQSIKNRMRIDFSPITLLYGPNSAGKSAVFDALDFLEAIWDPTKFNQKIVEQMVDRWARIENDNYLPMYVSIEFQYRVGDQEAFPFNIWNNDENWVNVKKTREPLGSFFFDEETLGEYDEIDRYRDTKIRLAIQVSRFREQDNAYVNYINISFSEDVIFEYGEIIKDDDDSETRLLLSHQAELDSGLPAYSQTGGIFMMMSHPDISHIDFYHTRIGYDYFQLVIPNLCLTDIFPVLEFDVPVKGKRVHNDTRLISYGRHFSINASDIIFYFGSLLGRVFRNSVPVVNADRRVPNLRESLFITGLDKLQGLNDQYSAEILAKMLNDAGSHYQDPHYEMIAQSARASIQIDALNDLSLIDRINEHLESHLFREKLYKIYFSSILMVPLNIVNNEYSKNLADVNSYSSAIRLFLRDGEGRKLEFQDVGSGIPFVLPVLCSVVRGLLSRVQQPELHLHPALQSELADIYISESTKDNDRNFIVETHSEHLLLRFLRRIRDTENGISSSENNPIKSTDIAIYYFDPQITGGTYVIKQPITPLGDFKYDWPRGFFAERDKDLFQ